MGGGQSALAETWTPYPLVPSTHIINPRPAAMGDAFTAVADDQNALYYNPAGLARLDTWFLEIMSLTFAASHDFVEAIGPIQDLSKLDKEKLGKDKEVYDEFVGIVRKLLGKPYYSRLSLNPYWVMKNFGLGLYTGVEMAIAPSLSTALIQADIQGDGDFRFGYAHNFFGEKLAVGAALAIKTRAHVNFVGSWEELGKYSQDGFNFVEEYVELGRGFGVDAGVLFTPIEKWSPTFGLSILNIGDTSYTTWEMDDIKKGPPSQKQAVNVGISLTPRFGSFFVRGAMDFRDMNLPVPASQKLRLGAEVGYGHLLKAQMGWANNAPTAGFETRLYVLNLRYATYVNERGYASGQHPSRVHMFNVKVLL